MTRWSCSYKHRLPKMWVSLPARTLIFTSIFLYFKSHNDTFEPYSLIRDFKSVYMTQTCKPVLLPVWSHDRDVKLTSYVSWRHIQCVHLPRIFGLSDCARAIWLQSEMGHAEQQPHFHPITGVAGGVEAPPLLICHDWGRRRWVSLAIKDKVAMRRRRRLKKYAVINVFQEPVGRQW